MEEALEKRLGELLLQLKSGDLSVLAEIDVIIGKRLRAYANIYYLQQADIDDAVQSLLCKLKDLVKSYRENKHAYSWIVKIFKNSILSRLRREKYEKKYLKMLESDRIIRESNLSDKYISNYLFFTELMTKLNKREQQLVKMLYLLDMSYAEIARELHIPKSTAEYQITKLKDKLKNME